MKIKRVAVIGAGVMGSGIAAHIANAGVPVLLMDIVPKDAAPDGRSAIAEGALARLKKTDPAPFMHKRNARLVTTGNIEDDLERPIYKREVSSIVVPRWLAESNGWIE